MFYIRDCNDNIVGNPAGYRTMRGAEAQYANRRSKVYRAIWAAFDARAVSYDNNRTPLEERRRNIMTIQQGDAA